MSLDWLYSLDELNAYRLDTEKGKERLEAQIKNLPGLLTVAGITLPKKPRILCLMAGSCIEGIAFAQVYDADVNCVDMQERLLAKGLKEAKKRKLKLHVVRGDVREPMWAPWIIEYMLKKNGFTKVEVKPYVDPYNMAQTYLHTAKSPNH